VAANDAGARTSPGTVGAGFAADFRVQFTPTSQDGRFGVFQLYVGGVPIGDGSTTAMYPHYQDLQRFCALAEQPSVRRRERAALGDTFDHLDLYWELTEADVVFTLTTRAEWGRPPSWAPPVGKQVQLKVSRSAFVSTWRAAEPQFRQLVHQE
jgi:hypothetical protein